MTADRARLAAEIGRILADDPICGGLVTLTTVDALAARAVAYGEEMREMCATHLVERAKPLHGESNLPLMVALLFEKMAAEIRAMPLAEEGR